MKLIGLSIEGLRKIMAAELDFDGQNLVQIRGQNGAGKSTVIDAIKYLLKGSRDIPENVVNHDSPEAVIIGRINDYIVRRVIKSDGRTALAIEKDGGKIARPQEFLDAISGQFLDPEYFMTLPPAEKRSMIVNMSGLDFTGIDAAIASAEQERLIKGRELKAIGVPQEVPFAEPVSISELLAERQKIQTFNEAQKKAEQVYSSFFDSLIQEVCGQFNGAISIDEMESALAQGKVVIDKAKAKIPPKPQPLMSFDEIDRKIANAEAENEKARRYQAYQEQLKLRQQKEKEYEAAQAEVERLRQEKSEMMNNARVPIRGLKITETGLEYKGSSCENWSTSESLKIALMLAVAYSGELKTIYIKRGESFDSASLAAIKAFAEQHDVQVIIEIVDDRYDKADDGIIWLEEGQVVHAKEPL
jgi:DNA repair exonuclease SbcCD ATPase subunit